MKIEKWRKQRLNAPDVTITMSGAKYQDRNFVLITLRNDCFKKFPSGYVAFDYSRPTGRLYMHDGGKEDGYCMYMRSKDPKQSRNRYMRIGQQAFYEMVKDLIGDYKLEYDSVQKAYYVDTRKK